MRFLQIVMARSGPTDPDHMAKVGKAIGEGIASGAILATGGIGKRATSAARVSRTDGVTTVEDPPSGDGWMAGGGYSLVEFASKDDAIANARRTLEIMGGGMLELIQVSEMHPKPQAPKGPGGVSMAGVIPYVNVEGANEAAEFYKKAFGAREVHRLAAEDGKRLMHCHLEINGGSLMLADAFAEYGYPLQKSHSFTMQLVVADVDAWWKRAVDAGCTIRHPLEVAFWGDRFGALVDPFGVNWAMSQPADKTA